MNRSEGYYFNKGKIETVTRGGGSLGGRFVELCEWSDVNLCDVKKVWRSESESITSRICYICCICNTVVKMLNMHSGEKWYLFTSSDEVFNLVLAWFHLVVTSFLCTQSNSIEPKHCFPVHINKYFRSWSSCTVISYQHEIKGWRWLSGEWRSPHHYIFGGEVLSAGPWWGQPVLAWPERSRSPAASAKWCQSVTGFHSMFHTGGCG